MAEDVSIRISAEDLASPHLEAVRNRLQAMGVQVEKVQKQSAGLMSSMGKLSGGMAQMAAGAGSLRHGFSGLVAGLTSMQVGAKNAAAGFKGLQGSSAGLAAGIGIGVVGAVVSLGSALVALAMKTAATGDALGDMSLRTGVSVEHLSTLRYAADQTNVTMDSLGTGMKQFARSIFEAQSGSKEQAETLAQLRLKTKDISGQTRPMIDMFMEAADRIRALKSETDRAAIAQKLFGRSGTDLLPFLMEGSASIQAMQERAKELRMEMSTGAVAASKAFRDKLDELKAAVSGVGERLGVVLLPALTAIVTAMVSTLDVLLHPVKTVKLLIREIGKIVDVMGVLFKRIGVLTKISFANIWTNVTILFRLYVMRPLLAAWEFMLQNFGGVLGRFGVDVQAQLQGVRSELSQMADLDLVNVMDGVKEAIEGVPWPAFEDGAKDATEAVKSFKQVAFPSTLATTSAEARTGGARFLGLPHTREWQAKIAHDKGFLGELQLAYSGNWTTMVSDHHSLWERFKTGATAGIADYRESLGTFASQVKDEVQGAMGELERGLSGGLRTLFFGKEDRDALRRSQQILQREARGFSGIQLDVFGESGTATQVQIQQIQNVFERATQGLESSGPLKRRAQEVRDMFIGLASPTATTEDAAKASRALEGLIDKIDSQGGFISRLKDFGSHMGETVATTLETSFSDLAAKAIMGGLGNLLNRALTGDVGGKSAEVGSRMAEATHVGMTDNWNRNLSFDFMHDRLKTETDSSAFLGKIGTVGSNMGSGVRQSMQTAWDGSSFEFMADKLSSTKRESGFLTKIGTFGSDIGSGIRGALEIVWGSSSFDFIGDKLKGFADLLPTGPDSAGDRIGQAIKNGLVIWATAETFESLTGIDLPGKLVAALAIGETVAGLFGTNMAQLIAGSLQSLFNAGSPEAQGAATLGERIGKLISGGLDKILGAAEILGQIGALSIFALSAANVFRIAFSGSKRPEDRETQIANLQSLLSMGSSAGLNPEDIAQIQAQIAALEAERGQGERITPGGGVRRSPRGTPRGEEEQPAPSGKPVASGAMMLSLSRLSDAARAGILSTTLEAQGISVGSPAFNNVIGLLQGDPAARQYLTSQGYIITAQQGLTRVPGPPSQPFPALLHGQEMVLPARQAEQVRSGIGGGVTVNFYLQSASDREVVAMIRDQLPMIERSIMDGIRKSARFGLTQFDERMIRTVLQS